MVEMREPTFTFGAWGLSHTYESAAYDPCDRKLGLHSQRLPDPPAQTSAPLQCKRHYTIVWVDLPVLMLASQNVNISLHRLAKLPKVWIRYSH